MLLTPHSKPLFKCLISLNVYPLCPRRSRAFIFETTTIVRNTIVGTALLFKLSALPVSR